MFNREPAAILGAVGALLALAIAFGFELSDEQVGAILAATSAVLALITRTVVASPKTLAELQDRLAALTGRGRQPLQ